MTMLAVLIITLVVLVLIFACVVSLQGQTDPFPTPPSTRKEKLVSTSFQETTINPCAELLKEEIYVGGYRIGSTPAKKGGLLVMMRVKPNFIKRFFMKHLLGWEWEDESRQRNQAR